MTHLRRLMQEELQRRNYSEITIRCYLHQVAAFAQHFGRSPDVMGAEEIKQWIMDEVLNFTAGLPQGDDITMIVLKMRQR